MYLRTIWYKKNVLDYEEMSWDSYMFIEVLIFVKIKTVNY